MSRGAASSAAVAVREVLGNRSIRRVEIAWTAGTAADWALLVVLLVVAYDAGGTLAAGILGAVRVVPAIIAAPFAATLVERYRGDRMLTAINLVRAGGAAATAIVVAADLPVEATYALAAVVAGAGSLVRPIQTALLPAFARTPRELVAANVASSTGEGIGTFVGPLLAGLLVAATGSARGEPAHRRCLCRGRCCGDGHQLRTRGRRPWWNRRRSRLALSTRGHSSRAAAVSARRPAHRQLRRPGLRPRAADHPRRGRFDRAAGHGRHRCRSPQRGDRSRRAARCSRCARPRWRKAPGARLHDRARLLGTAADPHRRDSRGRPCACSALRRRREQRRARHHRLHVGSTWRAKRGSHRDVRHHGRAVRDRAPPGKPGRARCWSPSWE